MHIQKSFYTNCACSPQSAGSGPAAFPYPRENVLEQEGFGSGGHAVSGKVEEEGWGKW